MKPTNSFVSTLGSPPSVGYLPGLALAPPPRHQSLRHSATVASKPRPSQSGNKVEVQRSAANVTGLAVAVVLLDHHTRQLQDFGKLNAPTAEILGQLVNLSDEVVEKMVQYFDGADADSVNALSAVIGQAVELMLQLTVPQIKKGLKHLHEMAKSNLK